MTKVVIFVILAILGLSILSFIVELIKKNFEKSLLGLFLATVCAVTLSVLSGVVENSISDWIRPMIFSSDASEAERPPIEDDSSQEELPPTQSSAEPEDSAVQNPAPTVPDTSATIEASPSSPAPEPNVTPEPDPAPAAEPEPEPEPEPQPEPVDPLSQIENITGLMSFSGKVLEKGQVNQYLYTAPVDGTYLFDNGLDFNMVSMEISNEYGGTIKNAYTYFNVDLEAGKTYILSVSYTKSPRDYTVQIGVPNPPVDITGQSSFSGAVTYRGQVNQYRYTAPVDGTYLFDSGLDFGSISMALYNEYGGLMKDGYTFLNVDLEAGKTYLFEVSYWNSPRDYTIQIGIPNPVADITGQSSVSGTITYYGQRDNYLYTAPFDGTYRFDSGLTFGAIQIEIANESGKNLRRSTPSLELELTAGTTYLLTVAYSNSPRDYTIQIELPGAG